MQERERKQEITERERESAMRLFWQIIVLSAILLETGKSISSSITLFFPPSLWPISIVKRPGVLRDESSIFIEFYEWNDVLILFGFSLLVTCRSCAHWNASPLIGLCLMGVSFVLATFPSRKDAQRFLRSESFK